MASPIQRRRTSGAGCMAGMRIAHVWRRLGPDWLTFPLWFSSPRGGFSTPHLGRDPCGMPGGHGWDAPGPTWPPAWPQGLVGAPGPAWRSAGPQGLRASGASWRSGMASGPRAWASGLRGRSVAHWRRPGPAWPRHGAVLGFVGAPGLGGAVLGFVGARWRRPGLGGARAWPRGLGIAPWRRPGPAWPLARPGAGMGRSGMAPGALLVPAWPQGLGGFVALGHGPWAILVPSWAILVPRECPSCALAPRDRPRTGGFLGVAP